MSTNMYNSERTTVYERPYYNEKDIVMRDRFYPGEFGMVVLLGIASLLVWSLCIYGITSEPAPDNNYHASNSAY